MPARHPSRSTGKAIAQQQPSHASRSGPQPVSPNRADCPVGLVQRALLDPGSLTSGDVLQLQHAIGNRAVSRGLTGSVRPPIVQPKLTVGPADDAYEQEADHVARQIAAQTHPTALPAADSGPGRQAGEEVQLMAAPITAIRRREDDTALRLSATSGLAGGEVPAGVESAIQNARGGGRSMGEDIRQPMEDAFGADFSQVRIHSDSHADRLNRSISAAAFTTGKDIFFRQGAFNPAREEGRALLAHELTHVVQQSGGTQAIRARLPTAQQSAASGRVLGQAPAITQRALPGRIHRCCFGSTCCKETTATEDQSTPVTKPLPRTEPRSVSSLSIIDEGSSSKPQTLAEQLESLGYSKDRNYRDWTVSASPHVSWKAHVGANPKDMPTMADVVGSRLRDLGISHKFQVEPTDESLPKFLTIYPPEDENDWNELISNLEPLLNRYGEVMVSGDVMQVGETGRIGMRFGQNTPLTLGMLKGIDVQEDGKLGEYARYTGTDVQGDGLPLLYYANKFFFSKSKGVPSALSPAHIYMAILYQGKVIPDKREEPNPANAPLPQGVKEFKG